MKPTTLYNLYLLKTIPISYLAGVRIKALDSKSCRSSVKLGLLNQNPFRSMFWAVQGMAAEFSTGILCADKIRKTSQKISMLVVQNKAEFTKKAVGRIHFSCEQGEEIESAIQLAIKSGEGQTLWLRSKGINEKGETVSQFEFLWSFKVKN
ncbi:DUF4442 domain-containing protein [Chryseobacterium sp. A301]